MNKQFLLYISLFISIKSFAQSDLNTYFMPSLAQKNGMNPALVEDKKWVIGADGSQGFYNTFGGIKTSDNRIVFDNPNTTESFFRNINWTLLNATLRLRENTFIGVSNTLRRLDYANISGEGAQLFIYGNAPFIGKTVAINPDVQLLRFNDFGISLTQKIGNLKIAGRVKFFSGINAVSTGNKDFSLTTDKDVYQLTLKTNYELFTAPSRSVSTLINGAGVLVTNVQGTGVGFDLGLAYDVNEKISVSAAVIDLGSIKWNGSNNTSNGENTYRGVDATKLFTGDKNFKISVNSDTLLAQLKFKTVENTTFKTDIPTTINLSGTYKINEKLSSSVLFSSTSFRSKRYNSLLINGQYQLIPLINVGLSYGVRNSYSMLGANITLSKGVFQIFALSDNILGLARPVKSANANGRVGVNLRF
jgi:Family of unknown function (DUF5723)